MCIHCYCAIIGVSYTQNPEYTLKIQNERVVALIIRHRRSEEMGIFKCVSTFTLRSLGSHIKKILDDDDCSDFCYYKILSRLVPWIEGLCCSDKGGTE